MQSRPARLSVMTPFSESSRPSMLVWASTPSWCAACCQSTAAMSARNLRAASSPSASGVTHQHASHVCIAALLRAWLDLSVCDVAVCLNTVKLADATCKRKQAAQCRQALEVLMNFTKVFQCATHYFCCWSWKSLAHLVSV